MSNLYLTSGAADAAVTGGPAGTKWKADQAAGAAARTIVRKCQNPVVSPNQMTDGTGTNNGTVVQWYSDPINAVTITGTITCSLWTFEGATTVNAAIAIQVERCGADGTVISTICANSVSGGGGECPTTAGNYVQTLPAASVTDTAMSNGDRLRITAWLENASAQGGVGTLTTATTRYAQMYINGPTGASGQSQLAFAESLTFTMPQALAQTGAGTDALSLVFAKDLADSGASADTIQAGAPLGLISGTASGTDQVYNFTVLVTDSVGSTATKALSITTAGMGTSVALTDAGAGSDALIAGPGVILDAIGPGSVSAGSSVSPLQWAHVNSNAGNAIIVGATTYNGSSNAVSAVAYGAASLGFLGFIPSNNGSGGGIALYGRVGGLPTGSNNVSVTFTGTDCLGASVSLISASALGSPGTAYSHATSVSGTVSSTTLGGIIIAVACYGGSGSTANVLSGTDGVTIRSSRQNSYNTSADEFMLGTILSAGGNQAAGFRSDGGADDWGFVGIEAQPSGSATALTDSGASAEALAVPAFAEQGGSSEALAVASTISLSEAGTGADLLFIPAYADTGTGDGSLSLAQPTPLTEPGAGTEYLAIPSFPDTGASTEVLGISQPSIFADTGHGIDLAFIPAFTESGQSADSIATGVGDLSVPLTESGAGTDILDQPTGLTESGAGAESTIQVVTTGITDTGAGLDSLAAAAMAFAEAGAGDDELAIPGFTETGSSAEIFNTGTGQDTTLSEDGAGIDQISIPAFAEPSYGADLLVVSLDVTILDAGAGDDSLFVTDLAESGAGTDTLWPGTRLTGTGTGADVLGTQTAAPYDFTDSGHSAESLLIPGFADHGASTESTAISSSMLEADQGYSTETFSLAYPAALPDSGAGTATLSALPGFADSGASADAISAIQVVAIAEAGAGLDSLGIASVTGLADTGAGHDGSSLAQPIMLPDAGTGSEIVSIVPGLTDTGASSESFGIRTYTGFPGTVEIITITGGVLVGQKPEQAIISQECSMVDVRNMSHEEVH